MQLPAILKHKKTRFILLGVIIAAALFLRLVVFGSPKIAVVHVEKRDLVAQVYGNGTVEAKVVVNIASKITGRIVEVGADQGDTVKRGQVLAKLDLSELQAQNRQAEASLALATKNATRFKALAAKELVSAQEAEQYETAYLLAKEAVVASRSRLADATIVAPEDGVIIRRDLELGATVTAGVPIFLMANPETVWVKANVDESQLKGVTPGQSATITLRSAPGEKFPGQVVRLAWESDRITEELEVDVAFTPPLSHFRLGEQAEVLIAAGARQGAPSIPKGALVAKGKQRGVWVVEGNRLRFQEVGVGLEDSKFSEITSGLAGNESIALTAPEKMPQLAEGQKVRVQK
ncbi:MAG: efflux RND transporter periplasmic adaptor subunit [Deltaproteobacteria bacterium]|nr:efflux RND transporter periplasmic adaptor subunit [Deltaproteobacteria bacterium]